MSPFALEALVVGVKEGVMIALCLLLVSAYLRGTGHGARLPWVHAGLMAVFLATAAVALLPVTVQARDILVRMIGYVFGLTYLCSLAALYQATGTEVFGPLSRAVRQVAIVGPLLFLLTGLYFAPEMASATLYLMDLRAMAGGSAAAPALSAAGFGVSVAAVTILGRRSRIDVLRVMALPQLLLILALIKLLSGGVRGFAELSLIPSVQSGLMKLIHDVIHQLLVMLQVPDHPILAVTTWNFIAILFGPTVGLVLSLVVFLLPLALFLRKQLSAAIPVPDALVTGAARRKYLREVRDDRLWKALPVVLFMVTISVIWFLQRGEGVLQRFDPDPVRVVAEKGTLAIPIQAPGSDLLDGRIHKYVVQEKGVDIRFLVLKKPDGTLVACLDACDICPPDGYAQTREHLVCLYCNTPIPVGSIGMPGGCNPIPLGAHVTDREVRISLQEVMGKWLAMMVGEGKRGVRR